jgi:hypothetical protein
VVARVRVGDVVTVSKRGAERTVFGEFSCWSLLLTCVADNI